MELPTPGVLEGVAGSVVLLDPGDETAMRETFANDPDIAATILEPTGSTFGIVPIRPAFLEALREATAQAGAVLIFDEVVTGFRVSPGGAQGEFGITPDLSTFAKILAGGLPGGALAGRKDLLDCLDFEVTTAEGREKIGHQGTYNANPVSAAAGTEMLRIVGSSDACARANDFGERLRIALNEVLLEEDVPWAAYGTFSGFHPPSSSTRRGVTSAPTGSTRSRSATKSSKRTHRGSPTGSGSQCSRTAWTSPAGRAGSSPPRTATTSSPTRWMRSGSRCGC